jgi:hypothetical protein
MKVTAQFSLVASLVFAAISLGVGLNGLSQVDAMADAAARADAYGYAWFWIFLAAVALACAGASWWIVRRENADPSD